MLILNEVNKVINTDTLNQEVHYSVLSFKDFRNPDFFFDKLVQIEEFSSPSVALEIGPFKMVMPLHWSVLCSDREHIQAIPLHDIAGIGYEAFCLNPIDGYIPSYLRIRLREIFPNSVWTCPPIDERNMLVVPLGMIERTIDPIAPADRVNEEPIERGPICAIFSPNRIDVSRPISDIW
jgi:hypothetical protein